MKAHWHNPVYKVHDFDRNPHLGITSAILIGAGIAAAGAVGGSMYSAQAEKTQQKKILADQDAKATALENKTAKAQSDANQTAADKITNKRRSLTQTILTSPLGALDDETSGTKRPTLLGGS